MSRTAKRVVRLLVLGVVLIGVALAVAALLSYRAATGEPDWYAAASQPAMSDAQRQAAARRVEQTLAATQNAVAAAPAPESDVAEAEPITVRLAEDEVNALIGQWQGHPLLAAVRREVDRPAVRFADGELVVAGRAKRRDVVLGLSLVPQPVDGGVGLRLDGVRAGRLPLPASMLDGYKGPLVEEVTKQLPAAVAGADLDDGSDGGPNDDAVKAAALQAALALLDGETTRPVVTLRTTRGWRAMRLANLTAEAGVLAITLEPLTAAEVEAFVADVAATAPDAID